MGHDTYLHHCYAPQNSDLQRRKGVELSVGSALVGINGNTTYRKQTVPA